MKRKILLAGVLSLSLIATGCGGQQPGAGAGEGAGQQAENMVEDKTPVVVDQLEKSVIRESFYSLGTVEAGRTYSMNALVSADVETVYVNVGDSVKAGDLLFKLETQDFNTTRTSQISSVKAQLDSAKIQKESAEKSYNDMKILFENGATSQSNLDSAKDAYDAAVISYKNAQTSYNTTISSLSSSEENYIVTSPIDGIVTARSVEEGQFATTQNGVTVSEYNPVKVEITIPGARVSQAYVGQPVIVTFPTQESEVEASLTALNVSGVSGGYPAEVKLDNPDRKYLPGMIAEVYLETERVDDAFVVTKNTVLEDETGNYVFVVKDGIASRVDVTRGIQDGERIQIIGALEAGDQIVVKGQHYLDDQEAVAVGN